VLEVFWVVAIVTTLLLVISMFSSALDMEFAPQTGEVLGYLSLRGLLAFLFGFSWVGALFWVPLGLPALALAGVAGFGFAWLNAALGRRLKALETSGNVRLTDALGQDGRVSVEVDAALGGRGKVTVRVKNREVELLAATEDGVALRRGELVQVYAVEGDAVLVSREDKLGIRPT
jgi:hypothetical protein